jgi:hypothetical protein
MAKRLEKKREPEPPAATRVLPMQLQIGDRLTDETGEYEIIGRPYTTNAGKDVHARVKKVGQPDALRHEPGARTSALACAERDRFHRPATTTGSPAGD